MGWEEEARRAHKADNPGFIELHPGWALFFLLIAVNVFWKMTDWYGRP